MFVMKKGIKHFFMLKPFRSYCGFILKNICQALYIRILYLRPCYTVQFFLQLAMQFYSLEMLISEISEEFSICWENISGV
jgi:hypothetical protein